MPKMEIAALVIIGYLSLTIALTWAVYRKSSEYSENKRIALRSGALALFYSPAVIWAFPFAAPAPAIVAIGAVVFGAVTADEWSRLMIGAVGFAFVPPVLFWLITIGIYKGVIHVRSARHNK